MSFSCLCVVSPNATPFLISVQDARLLDASEGFRILRKHLAVAARNDFCRNHDHDTMAVEDRQAWTVMRDILHALLAPIVALQEHATRVARAFTRSDRPEDFEWAYHGKGRNAFIWLQSFLSSDLDWCLSNDCPACIVEQALDAEFPIRMILASCLLSGIQDDTDLGRPMLPSFEFFGRSVRDAMEEDDLWGPEYFDMIEPKAYALKTGMQDLMKQCQSIELVMTPPRTPEMVEGDDTCGFFGRSPVSAGMPIQRSKFAKKQAKMAREEEQWLQQVVRNCWDSVETDHYAAPITTEFVRRMSTVDLTTNIET